MTKFRGCIDIHSGKVKQIVGSTLTHDDAESNKGNSESVKENFVSDHPSSYYANFYKLANLKGCHVIKLGTNEANDKAVKLACETWPYNLQVGGGITIDNALHWLDDNKASHVIVTSWLFTDDGSRKILNWDRLISISKLVGKSRLVVDLSCKQIKENNETRWIVAMNRWQTLTNTEVNKETLESISQYCDEFLVHAADVEGKCEGIDEELVRKLGEWCPEGFEGKVAYAGGANLVEDLDRVALLSNNKVDLTYGSALDIFGGKLVKLEDLISWNQRH